jgi:DNA-binding NarL/FixJ family response regulator
MRITVIVGGRKVAMQVTDEACPGFKLCEACTQALMESVQQNAQRSVDEHGLTPREEEVLRLVGAGLSNKDIARRLTISDKTVKTHLHHVYVKLRLSGR